MERHENERLTKGFDDMTFYPFVTEDDLLRQLEQERKSLHSGHGLWPAWMSENPKDLLEHKKFVICGSTCRPEIRVLAKHANVIAVVDDTLAKQCGYKVLGIDVIDSDTWVELARNDKNVVSVMLVWGSTGYRHFAAVAAQWGLRCLSPVHYLQLLSSCAIDRTGEIGRFFWYGEEFCTRTRDNLEKLVGMRNHFPDPWSRVTWLCILLYRLTLNPFYLTACSVGHNFEKFSFDSYGMNRRFFQFSDNEIYVDGGAFTGDTIALFIRAVQGKFRHIHSFEPSAGNNRTIRELVSRLQDRYLEPLQSRITLHEKGLWDADTTLLFNPCEAGANEASGPIVNPASAHLVEAGVVGHIVDHDSNERASIKVPVTTIDGATDMDATFIKLEIEGAELQALNGARGTIARSRPKMAISIYHKPEDLETLLEFVLQTGQDYQLGFRQHNPNCPDAMVLYCW